jgi:hypothetical protein
MLELGEVSCASSDDAGDAILTGLSQVQPSLAPFPGVLMSSPSDTVVARDETTDVVTLSTLSSPELAVSVRMVSFSLLANSLLSYIAC